MKIVLCTFQFEISRSDLCVVQIHRVTPAPHELHFTFLENRRKLDPLAENFGKIT